MGSGTKCSERRSIEKKTKQMVLVENYSIIRTETNKIKHVCCTLSKIEKFEFVSMYM